MTRLDTALAAAISQPPPGQPTQRKLFAVQHSTASKARNTALAKELGATVVRVKADRPADGLMAFAKHEGITHIIIGQSARSRFSPNSCARR